MKMDPEMMTTLNMKMDQKMETAWKMKMDPTKKNDDFIKEATAYGQSFLDSPY